MDIDDETSCHHSPNNYAGCAAYGAAARQVVARRLPAMMPAEPLRRLKITKQTKAWQRVIPEYLAPNAKLHHFLAGTKKDGMQGFVIFGPGRKGVLEPEADNPGAIYSLYVMPGFLGWGFGRAMMRAAMKVLRREGYTDVYLSSMEVNKPANRFYERQRGTCAGKRDQPIEGVKMPVRIYRWSLSPAPRYL